MEKTTVSLPARFFVLTIGFSRKLYTMIERKIAFHSMEKSEALKDHANERIDKIEKLLKGTGLPQSIEVRFKYNPHRAHHEIEIHLTSREVTTDIHTTNSKIYLALDEAMDRITESVRKIRHKHLDELHKVETPKTNFYNKKD